MRETALYDRYQASLRDLRDRVCRLIDLLQVDDVAAARRWKGLDARLLPLVDPGLPLMAAVCGGANSGKSTLFNSLLQAPLSPIRGDAGSTRRVLAALHPQLIAREDLVARLFEPFGHRPAPLASPADLLQPGPPLCAASTAVPQGLVLMDTPDFDTGDGNRYTNREAAAAVLEACNVLIYIVTNTTYNNLENTRFMRRILTEAGLRQCILVYSCSRAFDDRQVLDHLATTAANLYGARKDDWLIGCYRTDTSDAVAEGRALMQLRPVPPADPPIMERLDGLDPREIRHRQIATTLSAYLEDLRQTMAISKSHRDELALYAGALRLASSHAVRQSLASVPLERILQRMNTIWLETSPGYLKVFRGVGSVVGAPARLLVSLLKAVGVVEANPPGAAAAGVDPLDQLKSNLTGAAAELRNQLLADTLMADTTVEDPQGARLVALLDSVRADRGLSGDELPVRRTSAATGTVSLHVTAPACTAPWRRKLAERSWPETAERIAAAAETVFNLTRDAALNRELADLVGEFRRRMSFAQRTRESFFASLNLLPATLGMAYILTTGDPVGGSGIYTKLHGLFGMHDLWALLSIPASAHLDEAARRNLADMLAPVIARWFENRARIVRQVFDDTLSGEAVERAETTVETAGTVIAEIERLLEHAFPAGDPNNRQAR